MVLDHRAFERVSVDISRCAICNAGKAVYRSRSDLQGALCPAGPEVYYIEGCGMIPLDSLQAPAVVLGVAGAVLVAWRSAKLRAGGFWPG